MIWCFFAFTLLRFNDATINIFQMNGQVTICFVALMLRSLAEANKTEESSTCCWPRLSKTSANVLPYC